MNNNGDDKEKALRQEWVKRLQGGGLRELQQYAAFLDSLLAARPQQERLDKPPEKVV